MIYFQYAIVSPDTIEHDGSETYPAIIMATYAPEDIKSL